MHIVVVRRSIPEKTGRTSTARGSHKIRRRHTARSEDVGTVHITRKAREREVIATPRTARLAVRLPAKTRSLKLIHKTRPADTTSRIAVRDTISITTHERNIAGGRTAADTVA